MKFILSILMVLTSITFSQQGNPVVTKSDSAKNVSVLDSNIVLNDSSMVADSTIADTLKDNSDIDAIVSAQSQDSLMFDVKNKKMFVYGNGQINYKQTKLTSGNIFVDFRTNSLEALGVRDTSDSTGKKLVQTPILSEGSDNYEGKRIKYNFKTQRGFISMAKNKDESKRYEGVKVKKIDKKSFFIEDGIYTTCPADTPHTYFSASQMKVIQGEQIIAKWVFMYIGGVPLPIPLPFGVFPNNSGRASGILPPTYGSDVRRGQYFSNFGYYFALSDYFDLTLTGDYYTRGGYGLSANTNYVKRYEYNGRINLRYSKILVGEKNDPDYSESTDWSIGINHNQTIDPTSRFSANLQFQSGTYLRNNSTNYNDILRQNVHSSAKYSKRWDESGNSVSVSYARNQNLESGDITEELPDFTFNKKHTFPFKSDSKLSTNQAWYEYIGYSYNAKVKNRRSKTNGVVESKNGAIHNLAISASPKISYFNISPNISYKERWYTKRNEKYIERTVSIDTTKDINNEITKIDTTISEEIRDREKTELNSVRTFSLGVSASTKIYGMANINAFGIDAFRHTLTPTISYSYSPNFSDDKWGYYDEIITPDGDVLRYDKYQNQIFQGVGISETQNINFSIGNLFEIKTLKDPTDTTSKAQKIRLLNLNANMSYNFASDSLRLSNLNLSGRTQIGELLDLNASASYSFYDYVNIDDSTNLRRTVNRFLLSEGKGLFRLNNLSFRASIKISGDQLKSEDDTPPSKIDDQQGLPQRQDYIDVFDDIPPDLSIPWNLSLNYNYNLSKFDPSIPRIRSNIGANFSFNLTKSWKFTVTGNYDFQEKKILAPRVTVFKELDCWQMSFNWNPLGTYRGYRFEIKLKAPELSDIKVTQARGLYSGRR